MDTLPEILLKIKTLSAQKDRVLVAIDGRGGSGKTTTALLIKHEIPDAEVITTDDFLDEDIHRIDVNQLKLQVLIPLSKGEEATYMEFDGKSRSQRGVKPKGIIIVEGTFSSHSLIQEYYDITIWVKASDADERVEKRDGEIHENWEKYYRPDEDVYIAEDHPEDRATYIIENIYDENLSDLDSLWAEITG